FAAALRLARSQRHALGHAARRSPDDDDQPSRRVCRRRHRARCESRRVGQSRRARRQRGHVEMVEGEGKKREEGRLTNRGKESLMSTWKSILLAGTIVVAPVSAAAQEAPAAEALADEAAWAAGAESEASLGDSKAKMQQEMDAAIAIIEKMFDTSDLPPIDPARLALAEGTTAALIPNGSLEKMMDNLYGKML